MKLIPVQVDKISFHPPSHSYAVILKELEGERKLPVIVGAFEAQSIALALENVTTPRPMTHDLIGNIIDGMEANLTSVTITELSEGVYYAQLEVLGAQFGPYKIDSRPSDAVAIALRMNAPIMVADQVMRESAVLDEEIAATASVKSGKKLAGFSRENLEKQLDQAVEQEEYEIAAKLRDQIRELNS